MNDLPEIEVSARAARRVEEGYLWIFSNEIGPDPNLPETASWCRFTRARRVVATGYFNRRSLIAGRVVAQGAAPEPRALLRGRLVEAFERRRPWIGGGAAVRLAFAEADLLPGLVIDFYPPYAVLQSSTAGMDLRIEEIEALVPEVFAERFGAELDGMVLRCDSGARRLEGLESYRRVCFGDPAALAAAAVTEDGVQYVADLIGGQKTGFFLDQRDNRRAFAERVRERPGCDVLDLYGYNGGWGLRALRAGAGRVRFVDRDREAFHLLAKGLAANGLAREQADFVEADVFEFLDGSAAMSDFIVADPPAFVKSRKNLPQARKAYLKLSRLAWRRLRAGGLLFSCSCSHLLPESEFLGLLAEAVAKEKGLAQVFYRGRQPGDHPVLLSMPETAYLKCVGLRKLR